MNRQNEFDRDRSEEIEELRDDFEDMTTEYTDPGPEDAESTPAKPDASPKETASDEDDDLTYLDDSFYEQEEYEDDYYEDPPKTLVSRIFNIHTALLAVLLVCGIGIFLALHNFGVRIDQDDLPDNASTEYTDKLDMILPLLDADGKRVDRDVDTIVCFGNAPFADDRDSADGLCNMIAEATGATVYNCAVTGSYMAAQSPYYNPGEEPMDAYTLYWLVTLAARGPIEHYYPQAEENLGDATPIDGHEVAETIKSIDWYDVDVVTIMYDATDYLLGHMMYSDENNTDIEQFTGNLEASIELLQLAYPDIRIIVMSPTYAFAVEEDGSYVSSDMKRFGQDVLSTYSIKEYQSAAEHGVTFLDHLYGTVTEENARELLSDNIHLNQAGRKAVLDRFLYALNFYKN